MSREYEARDVAQDTFCDIGWGLNLKQSLSPLTIISFVVQ